MVCRLCLVDSTYSVDIFSEEKVVKYIEKYFHLKLNPTDTVSKVICSNCWEQLNNFEEFCFRIEEAQKSLIQIIPEELKSDVNVSSVVINKEVSSHLCDTEGGVGEFKEEDCAKFQDETREDNKDEHVLDEVKNELDNDQLSQVSIRSTPEQVVQKVSTKRVTRSSKRASAKTEMKIKTRIKSKCIQESKSDPGSNSSQGSKNDQAPKETEDSKGDQGSQRLNGDQQLKEKEQINNDEVSKDDEDIKDDLELNTLKRKRGRPKKGEYVVKKEKKAKSERTYKIYETAREFDKIIQKHMNLSCNVCAVSLTNFAELKRHFRIVHNRRGYAICCNKRLFKRGLVVDHINTHINPEHFKCDECGKVLADRMCLRTHVLLNHSTEDLKVFQCDYCPQKYAKQYLLDHHRTKHIPKEECTFVCSFCESRFPTYSTLSQHMSQTHLAKYDKMCEICAKVIRGTTAFERHMDDHAGKVNQVQCEECGIWLKNKNNLRKHMKKHDGKTYPCSLCGKIKPSKSALLSHIKYVHQTERQFKCTYCDKSFKKAINLKEHLTTHTGEVLYTCPHCPKTFNSRANMHSHRKKIHREEWEANRRSMKKIPTEEPTLATS